jgi:hypothetical protein
MSEQHLESGWRQLLWPTNPAELSYAVVDLDPIDVDWIKETLDEFNEVQAFLNDLLEEKGCEPRPECHYTIPVIDPNQS